ncbi:sigma-54 interaction domain-containing protein [Algiphilus sp.]|uniref:sigma-54 interaction domain-containing protein n=1 Tax=Algiphilus sp. TaxID=1872431 RepID=UPI003B52A682
MDFDTVMTLEPPAERDEAQAAKSSRIAPPAAKASPAPVARRLIGDSPSMVRVRTLIGQVAAFDTNVLITGESGTGKELVARAIHEASDRAHRPFVAINCGAIPAELLESELFGHERGAFTGAIAARKGRFELAEGGTLFLDELGDMPLPMQVKLLRVIQERSYERVGGSQTLSCNVRIVAATHRDLEARVSDGSFREDLYYRVAVFPIELPPLRKRVADLPLLIEALATRIATQAGEALQFDASAHSALQGYGWPGNVRELANLIERLAVTCTDGTVTADDLPLRYRADLNVPATASGEMPCRPRAADNQLPADGIDLRDHLARIEASLIREALARSEGVVTHAAQLLRVSRTTLIEKLRKYDITPDGASAPSNG